jgi:hypothetical protein
MPVERPQELDQQTTAEILGVAAAGARALLTAESVLNTLSKGRSETELAALDEIETNILVAQALLKSIGCAALRNLPADFELKPDDENAFNQIIEDDEKHSLAAMKNTGIW